ncbi:MAG: hypothetical protein EOP62_10965 [Sphingomonadales bacterium]|nr:MAG: hypothetical protein EOP62_10965 [Sphingomonadales bacterium]
MSGQKIARNVVGKVVGLRCSTAIYYQYLNALFGYFNFHPLCQRPQHGSPILGCEETGAGLRQLFHTNRRGTVVILKNWGI